MNGQQKEGKKVEKVVVAVRASKEIPKAALVWALTHVVQPGDCISLIVVVPPQTSGRRLLWGFPRFAGDCANAHKRAQTGTSSEHKLEISDTCSQMILQLHNVYDPSKISVNIMVVSTVPSGAVAAEAKNVQASWVVLDKDLKTEEKHCMDELHCNIVGMRRAHPKVLRLSLVGSPTKEPEVADLAEGGNFGSKENSLCSIRGPTVTPSSSPEMFTATDVGTSSVSSSDPSTSPFSISDVNLVVKKDEAAPISRQSRESCSETDSKSSSSMPCPTSSGFRPWMDKYLRSHTKGLDKSSSRISDQERTPSTRWLLDKLSTLDQEAESGSESYLSEMEFGGNVREAISLSRSPLPGPPPLCTICQHKAPIFGKPPRWFGYAELEVATGGFSRSNFLAEGGYGSVHRGALPDGQVIAVKQHKLASSQGDVEFCSEVEVLSCAQHRNVVMLIGYCIEDKRRLLVYEYICNGSLDSHLYGRNRDPLEWHARQKVAVGAARGLRYLHEECRVGCIVHRDMRPNNILLTHDYEPLVGDFGLARWQPDGDTGEQTRVIGTFGYLAPEYAQSGQITEKADVYSFGVVLVEMLTGRKAVDLSRPKGQQCLTEWARPLLEEYTMSELMDPRLGKRFSEQEVRHMMHAASLCIRRDPHSRPRMSQVLRILEGDMFIDSDYMSTPGYNGSCSGRLRPDYESYSGLLLKEGSGSESEVFKGSFSFDSVRAALWSRD